MTIPYSDPPKPEPAPPRPEPMPWHDPGPPVRKVNLPPDSPTQPVPLTPERAPEESPAREPP
jgi:hypothetical protein